MSSHHTTGELHVGWWRHHWANLVHVSGPWWLRKNLPGLCLQCLVVSLQFSCFADRHSPPAYIQVISTPGALSLCGPLRFPVRSLIPFYPFMPRHPPHRHRRLPSLIAFIWLCIALARYYPDITRSSLVVCIVAWPFIPSMCTPFLPLWSSL